MRDFGQRRMVVCFLPGKWDSHKGLLFVDAGACCQSTIRQLCNGQGPLMEGLAIAIDALRDACQGEVLDHKLPVLLLYQVAECAEQPTVAFSSSENGRQAIKRPMADETRAERSTLRTPIVVELGMASRKHVDELHRGVGRIADEVRFSLREIRRKQLEHLKGEHVMPIVLVYTRSLPRRNRTVLRLEI